MKAKYLVFALGLAALATACTDQDYMELTKEGSVKPLELTTDNAQVVLEEGNHSNEAVALNWTPGTNYGTNSRISYTLLLDRAEADFSAPITIIDNKQREYSWKPSVESLNAMVVDQLGATYNEPIELAAKIIANVENFDPQEAIVNFVVTPYKPVTETLYLIGSAAPSGWSADNATEMTRTDNGIFEWKGKLREGEFKFITTLGEFIPSYNKGADDNTLVYRESYDEPDEKFNITKETYYKVNVNLLTLTISWKETDAVDPPITEQLYFVGNETGWSFWPMTVDPLDPYLFRIGVFFEKGGEFKFGTKADWDCMFKAPYENAPYTAQDMQYIKGYDPDPKWVLTDAETNKAYKICCDIRLNAPRMMMTEFIPYTEMYLIGSACAAGWDINNALPMTLDASNPYVFTWTGELTADGELKFTCDKRSDWGGAWFLADKTDKTPTGEVEKMLFIDKASQACAEQYLEVAVGDVDQKWKITSTGNYTITLNQLYDEVTIVKN